jgi:hypothetical protein
LNPTWDNYCSVQKLLSFVKTTLKWRLMDRKPLNTWVHSQGRLALLGDACHPMLVCHLCQSQSACTVLSKFPSSAISRAGRRDRGRGRSGDRCAILAGVVAFASSHTPTSIPRPSVRNLPLFASPPPRRGENLLYFSLSLIKVNACAIKVTPCDSHARIIPPEPEDLPSTGRSRTTRTR